MKAVSRFCLLSIVGSGMLLASGMLSDAYPSCLSDKPEAILDCLSEAYAAKDTTLYRQLFADDCRFILGSDSTSWGVDKDYPAAKELFGSATKVEVKFPDRGSVSPGDQPDTWVLSGVATVMRIETTVDGRTQQYEASGKGAILRVRRVKNPKPHILIYSYMQPSR